LGYLKYDKLTDEQCAWVLGLNGKSLFQTSRKLFDEKKIDSETLKQMCALWLNERNIKGPWIKYK
jgi:hypothetical protein